MNNTRRRQVAKLAKKLEEIKSELSRISYEEQNALDNMPSNLLHHGRKDAMEDVISYLDDADNSLQEVLDCLSNVINVDVEYKDAGEPLFEKVAEYIVVNNDASITHIKRDFHIGQDRARNIIWRLISADVLDGILFGSPQKVTVKVHDLDMLKEKLDIYDRCRKLKERFSDKYSNIDVFGPHHSTAIQKTIGTYSLAVRLTEERKWWICEVTKEERGMGSVGDYATPLELAPDILDEFKGIFDTFEDTVMRKEFFASIEDPIDGFVKAYEKLMQLEKEGKLPQF